MQWYQTKFRRNLVDMHIEDWNEEFLSQFDPETYVENLKRGHINAPMLYLQSHVGLCYWPTRSGKMHNAFIGCEDKMKRVEQLCHQNGMAVIAYYSLIYNNWAHEKHPDWRIVDLAGRDTRSDGGRYGQCCPNNMEYRAFTETQIRELCEYFDFEGIFYDMLFWTKICVCPSCRARWEKEVGGPLPEKVDWQDPRWRLFQQKRCEWMGEFAQWVTGLTHKYKPGASVEHQYSTIMHPWRWGVNENIALASTYSGGDLYGGIEEQSFACKLYYGATENQPFEYMTSRAYPALSEHTTTKSEDMLRQHVMMTCAHHGANLLIDAIDPIGTMDQRVYERIGKIYREAEKFESVMSLGEQAFDVALYYDLNGKYDPEFPAAGLADDAHQEMGKGPMHNALLGAARSLRAHHIPYGIVNNHYFDRYRKAKVLVLSDVPQFEDGKVDAVLEYVRNGGSLYLSGHCHPRLLEAIFGLQYTGWTEESVTYVSPTSAGDAYMEGHFTHKYPLVMFERQPTVSGTPKGTVLGTLTLPYTIPNRSSTSATPFFDTLDMSDKVQRTLRFASIHSNPPGIYTDAPAMVYAEYGKGKCVWSAAPIERPNREQHSDIFARIIAMLAGNRFCFSMEAPEHVEGILFDAPEEGKKVVSVINMFEAFHIPEARDISLSLPCAARPAKVRRGSSGEEMPFAWENGTCTVHFDALKCCEMVEVSL